MPLLPEDATNRPIPLSPMGAPGGPSPRLAAVFMLLSNLIGALMLVDAVPNEPPIIRKLILAASLLLSTYGFRSALAAKPPQKD